MNVATYTPITNAEPYRDRFDAKVCKTDDRYVLFGLRDGLFAVSNAILSGLYFFREGFDIAFVGCDPCLGLLNRSHIEANRDLAVFGAVPGFQDSRQVSDRNASNHCCKSESDGTSTILTAPQQEARKEKPSANDESTDYIQPRNDHLNTPEAVAITIMSIAAMVLIYALLRT